MASVELRTLAEDHATLLRARATGRHASSTYSAKPSHVLAAVADPELVAGNEPFPLSNAAFLDLIPILPRSRPYARHL